MKKLLSVVMTLVLLFSFGVTTNAAKKASAKKSVTTEVKKTGVLKAFTENSVTVLENGKTVKYVINDKTAVESLGTQADLLDVAKKGLKVTYKVLEKDGKAQYLTFINFPATGSEGQGALGLSVNDRRDNVTDSSIIGASTANFDDRTQLVNASFIRSVDNGYVEDNVVALNSDKTVDIGDVLIQKGSVKVTLKGKELKVIDGNFDPAVVGDEVKLNLKGTFYSLIFEAPIYEGSVTQDELDEILKVTYNKKEYAVTTVELSSFPIHEDVYAELNGKEVPLAKALYRGTYAYTTANTDGEVIYVDAFYKDLTAEITNMEGNKISIKAYRNDVVIFTDVLTLSDALEVFDANGDEATIWSAIAAKRVLITVDSFDNYGVSMIKIVK